MSRAPDGWLRSLVGISLVTLLVTGCMEGPVFNATLIVEVFNQTNSVGSLRYQGPGPSGTDPIEPCRSAGSARGLGPGTWQITISNGSQSLKTTLVAQETGEVTEAYVIRPDGEIDHLYEQGDQDTAPPPPFGCPA